MGDLSMGLDRPGDGTEGPAGQPRGEGVPGPRPGGPSQSSFELRTGPRTDMSHDARNEEIILKAS